MRQLPILFLVSSFVIAVRQYRVAKDQYWICFSGSVRNNPPLHPPAGSWQLMKIDALGNVIIPPTIVVRNSSQYLVEHNAGAALSHNGTGRLNLWVPTRRRVVTGNIFRAVIDKRSLKLLSFRQTGISTINKEHLQVTQSGPIHFLATQTLYLNPERSFYVGNALSPEGTLLGQRWLLTPGEASYCTCGMGIDSGGRVFFFTEIGDGSSPERAMLQHLDESGRPKGVI